MTSVLLIALTAGSFVFSGAADAQDRPAGSPGPVITERLDETRLVRLEGNTRPEANARNDRGRAPDELSRPHMLLLLKRSPRM